MSLSTITRALLCLNFTFSLFFFLFVPTLVPTVDLPLAQKRLEAARHNNNPNNNITIMNLIITIIPITINRLKAKWINFLRTTQRNLFNKENPFLIKEAFHQALIRSLSPRCVQQPRDSPIEPCPREVKDSGKRDLLTGGV